jgi:N-acyl-phosphatidylethanolamine-hydrolysing phospholipase D
VTKEREINRRNFMKSAFTLGKWAVLWGLLPLSKVWGGTGTGLVREAIFRKMTSLSLRDIASRKLHHGKEKFLNPFSTAEHGGFSKVLYWKLFGKNPFKSFYKDEQTLPVEIDWEPIKRHDGCGVTFVKHACVMIKDLDRYLMVDPVLSGLMWFKDFSPISFDLDTMPRPDHILITHGHYDHLDKSSLKHFERDSHVISPLGYDGVFKDLEMNNRTRLDWFEVYREGKREIVFLPCNHWTMRNPFVGPNRSLWGSYLLKGASGSTIYISGDLAYFDRFQEIGKTFPIDLAIFNLGAYEPRWFMATSHLNPAETVQAFLELDAKRLMVVHWGTFRLGNEPVHFPPMDIEREMERRGVADRLVHLHHGETYYLK